MRPRDRSPQLKVGVTRESRHRSLHLQLRRGLHMNVELDSIERRVGVCQGRIALAVLQIRAEVKIRSHRQLRHHDLASQSRGRWCAHPMQFGAGSRTHSRRIAQPHFLAGGRHVEAELLIVVSRVPFEIDGAASGARRQFFDV